MKKNITCYYTLYITMILSLNTGCRYQKKYINNNVYVQKNLKTQNNNTVKIFSKAILDRKKESIYSLINYKNVKEVDYVSFDIESKKIIVYVGKKAYSILPINIEGVKIPWHMDKENLEHFLCHHNITIKRINDNINNREYKIEINSMGLKGGIFFNILHQLNHYYYPILLGAGSYSTISYLVHKKRYKNAQISLEKLKNDYEKELAAKKDKMENMLLNVSLVKGKETERIRARIQLKKNELFKNIQLLNMLRMQKLINENNLFINQLMARAGIFRIRNLDKIVQIKLDGSRDMSAIEIQEQENLLLTALLSNREKNIKIQNLVEEYYEEAEPVASLFEVKPNVMPTEQQALTKGTLSTADTRNKTSKKPIYLAIEKGNIDQIEALIELDSNLINEMYKNNWTLLHYAVDRTLKDKTEAILNFLLKNGLQSKIDEQSNNKDTALHLAVKSENLKAVKILLEYGADKNIKNIKNKTPLNIAKEEDYKEIIKLLN